MSRTVTPVTFVVVLVWGLAALSVPTAQAGGPSKDQAEATKDLFNEQMRSVREGHLLLPMNYLEVDGRSYGYHLPRRFVRMAGSGDVFRVRKLKTKDNMLKIEVESNREVRQKIVVFDEEREVTGTLLDEVLPLVLADIFEFGTPPQYPGVVANTRSGLAHLGICNHLPAVTLREPFDTAEAAVEAGFRLCPSCFPPDPPLPYPEYMPTRIAALERARLYERAFPLIADAALQDSLQVLGEALVAGLPFPPKGFPYRFRGVQSEVMQGVSMATGFIYVTDKLLDAVEDELELAHVLAHEIVHCEIHLPPNPQVPQPRFALPEAWRSYSEQLRSRQTEADMVALATMARVYPEAETAEAAGRILRKLQFANEAAPAMDGGDADTHPSYGLRLDHLKNGFFPVGTEQYFEALGEDGQWICRVKVLGGGFEGEKTELLYLLTEMADGAGKSLTIKSYDTWIGQIRSQDGTEYHLESGVSAEIEPGQMAILIFGIDDIDREDYGCTTPDQPKLLDPGRLVRIKLNDVSDVDRWVLRQGTWE